MLGKDRIPFRSMSKRPVFQDSSRGSSIHRKDKVVCYSCGNQGHFSKSSECPAKGRTCRRCRGLDHYEAMCQKRKQSSEVRGKSKRIFNIERASETNDHGNEEHEELSENSTKVYYAFYGGNESNTLDCVIGGISLKVLIDSGADANLIRVETWNMMKNKGIQVHKSSKGCSRVLKGYGSDKPLSIIGTFEANVSIGRRTTVAEFFVVKGGQKDIIGDLTAKRLGVLKVGIEVNSVDTEVKPFSKINGVQAHISIEADARPVFNRCVEFQYRWRKP